MTAAIIQLANAVVTDLNAQTFSATLTAARAYVPRFDLENSETLQCKVVPTIDARQPASRGEDQCDLTIDIGLMQKFEGTAAEELTAIDALMALAEEVKEYLSRIRPTDFSAAICTAVKNEPIFDVEQMESCKIFLTVISATFRVEVAV